jgi:hypothetical protein
MDAGVDFSGTADAPDEHEPGTHLFVASAVYHSSAAECGEFLNDLRVALGWKLDAEFHAYKMRKQPAILESIMQFVIQEAHVTVLILDKTKLTRSPIANRLNSLHEITGRLLMDMTLGRASLRRVYIDEDIDGRERRSAFTTYARQAARRRGRLPLEKVRYHPSDTSPMIQLADGVAYAVQRDIRQLSESATLRQLVRALREKEGNVVATITEDDLRPYL